jgi:hypothetical protein
MSLDDTTEAATKWLARRRSRRTALGIFAGATAALGLGSVGLSSSRAWADSGTFTLVNQSGQTIWPGVYGSNSIPDGGGFELASGASTTLTVPANWSGRIWARTYCTTNSDGSFSCETGDCGALACNGATGSASATLAEFTLGGGSAPDYYDVSLVDAFNLPMTIAPQGGSGCTTAGCSANLLTGCPSGLQSVDSSGNLVACLSACTVYQTDEACCTGAAATNCDPSQAPVDSASYFKSGCPDAYSYANDPVTSTLACSGASGYVITFYPFTGSGSNDPAPDPSSTSPAPTTSPAAPAPAPGPGQPWTWGVHPWGGPGGGPGN